MVTMKITDFMDGEDETSPKLPKPTELSPRMWLEDLPLENPIIRNLKKMGYEGLLDHQLQALALFYDCFIPIDVAIPRIIINKNTKTCQQKQYQKIILSWKTSAGKTVIAMLFIDKWLRERMGVALYCLPYKALAEEMYTKFQTAFKGIWNVGISTGDYSSVTIEDIHKYNVVIVTYDKLNSLLRKDESGDFRDILSCVALDEFHMIESNPVIEDDVMKLKNTNIPLIALSATVGNESLISKWMSERNGEAILVHSDFRPIELKRGFFVHSDDSQIRYEDGTVEKCSNFSDNPYVNSAVHFLRKGMSVIEFRQSRKNAKSTASSVAEWFEKKGTTPLELGVSFEESSNKKVLEKITSYGCGFHHSGLLRRDKNLITELYESRQINFIASTTTLSAGINIPASVGLVEFMRYDGKGMKPIPKNEALQCFGRIGRPQYDSHGTALLLLNAKGKSKGWIESAVEELTDLYFFGRADPITSHYYEKENLSTFILGAIASGDVTDIHQLENYLKGSLAYMQNQKKLNANADDILYEMKYASHPLITIDKGKIEATPLGKTVNRLYIHPETAIKLIEASKALPSDASDLAIMFWVASSPEFRTFYPPKSKRKGWMDMLEEKMDELHISHIDESYINPLMTAMVLVGTKDHPYAWIKETNIESLENFWSIQAGDLQGIVGASGSADWIMYAFSVIASILKNKELAQRCKELKTQIRYGVKKELIDLVAIRGVGRVRARGLWNAGYKNAYDLANVNVEQLSKVGINGRYLGEKIASQLIINAGFSVR